MLWQIGRSELERYGWSRAYRHRFIVWKFLHGSESSTVIHHFLKLGTLAAKKKWWILSWLNVILLNLCQWQCVQKIWISIFRQGPCRLASQSLGGGSIHAKHVQLWLKKETDFKMDELRLRTGRNETLLTEILFCDTDLEKKGFITLLNHCVM